MTIFDSRKVVVSVGTGGVGKTTVSAAIAVAAAAAGKRTLVMTIDPARRLANALGLEDFGNTEREIPAAALRPFGVELKAPLWAMMPDVKRTFDELIERTAPNEEQRQRIMSNKIYQQFSGALAGSLEYAAVEKLYEVYQSGRYDLIVLDTPPSQNAVDFLGAPTRIIDFLEQETIQWLLKPYLAAGRFSVRLLDLGSSIIYRTLGKLAGGDTLRQLVDFLLSFQGMYDGFRQRSERVRKLLSSDELAFVLVATTRGPEKQAMLRFYNDLQRQKLMPRAVVVNRVRQPLLTVEDVPRFETQLSLLVPNGEARAAVQRAVSEEQRLAEKDASSLAELTKELPDVEVLTLPELPLDAHDLESLARLCAFFRVPTES